MGSNGKGTCVYHTPSGRKCAVGCLLPDEEYAEHHFDNCAIDDPEDSAPIRNALRRYGVPVGPKGIPLLTALQKAHDGGGLERTTPVAKRLHMVATEFKLTWPEEIPITDWAWL